jgi:hypothetical protein
MQKCSVAEQRQRRDDFGRFEFKLAVEIGEK